MTFTTEESVFNMALAYLKRIDKLLYLCQKSAIEQDADLWVAHLRGVYRETSVKLKPEEEKDLLGDPLAEINLKELTDNLIKPEEANFKNIYFLLNNPKTKVTQRKVALFLLDALEIKIRKILQKKGMLLPSKEDQRFAITQR